MPAAPALRTTALNSVHRALGARMVDFGGWDMPVRYSGIIEEHNAVRHAIGVFDVSHMGEIEIRGPEAARLTDFVTTNAVHKLKPGQAHYSGLLYEHGGFVDDILVHKVSDEHYFLCVNASNQDKDFEHIVAHDRFDAVVTNAGEGYAQIAIQGPKAGATLPKLTHQSRRWKPVSAGSSNSTRASSWDATRCSNRERTASGASSSGSKCAPAESAATATKSASTAHPPVGSPVAARRRPSTRTSDCVTFP